MKLAFEPDRRFSRERVLLHRDRIEAVESLGPLCMRKTFPFAELSTEIQLLRRRYYRFLIGPSILWMAIVIAGVRVVDWSSVAGKLGFTVAASFGFYVVAISIRRLRRVEVSQVRTLEGKIAAEIVRSPIKECEYVQFVDALRKRIEHREV